MWEPKAAPGFPFFSILVLILAVTAGCNDPIQQLDRVAASVDRYGFASISTPFLAGPTDAFGFDLSKSASEYFDLAFKPEGGVRDFASEASDTQVAFRANLDQAMASMIEFQKFTSLTELRVGKVRAGAQKKLIETMLASNPALAASPLGASGTAVANALGVLAETPEPEIPEFTPQSEGLPPPGAPIPTDSRAALAAVGGNLSPSLGFPEGPFQISANQAIMLANRDIWTQSLFSWFAKPHGNKLSHYELVFCPMVVSVQPGYETRDGYLADITVNVDLARRCNCACPDKAACKREFEYLSDFWDETSPPLQVAGVFPVIDSQVLDVVNSQRQLHSWAAQLSIMGMGTQSDFFKDYAKKLETDAKTATTLTAASAYTIGATAFGFRVEPKLVASKDPGQPETRPGRVLESRTFPAMAAILINREYLRREMKRGRENTCPEHDDQRKEPPYDYLVFETSTRWSPMHGGAARYSEVDFWKRAEALDEATRQLRERKELANPFQKPYGDTMLHQFELRATMLRKMALSSRAVVQVYDKGPRDCVTVHAIEPATGWLDQFNVLTITGEGFKDNVRFVSVGGIPCDFMVQNDRTLLVGVSPWAEAKKAAPARLGELASVYNNLSLDMGGGIRSLDSMFLAASKATDSDAERESDAKESLEQVVCAEVVVSSNNPIHVDELLKAPDGCKDIKTANCDGKSHCSRVGWVIFNKKLPSGSASPPPKVTLSYDEQNKAIRSVTAEGNFTNAAHLLQVVKEAIREGQGVELKLTAGGVNLEATGNTP